MSVVQTSSPAGRISDTQRDWVEGMLARSLISSDFTEPPSNAVAEGVAAVLLGANADAVTAEGEDITNHPGVWQLLTGTTSSGRATVKSEGVTAPGGITQDGSASSGSVDALDTLTISHTTSAGLNRLLIVGVSILNDDFEGVDNITYNGVNLTFLDFVANADDARVEFWYLLDADLTTGTNDVVITFDATLTQQAIAGVMTFQGVDQVTPFGTFASDTDTSGTPSVTVSSAGGDVVFAVKSSETSDGITTEPPAVEHWNIQEDRCFAAGATDNGAASVTVNWTLVSSDHWAAAGVPIKPAAVGASDDGTYHIGVGGITRVGTWLRTGADLSTPSERYVIRSGLLGLLGTDAHQGVGFEYQDDENGGRWQAITVSSSTETSVDTGVTVAADTWYRLEFEVNAAGTSVEFFIDGVSVGTITTNIPSGTDVQLFYNTHIAKLAGTASRSMILDAYYVYQEINR